MDLRGTGYEIVSTCLTDIRYSAVTGFYTLVKETCDLIRGWGFLE